MIFGGVASSVTVDGIPASVVSLVENDKSNFVTGPVNPVNEVIFGGVVRSVTVDGVPASVVSLVDCANTSCVTVVGIPLNEVIFGGVKSPVTVDGIFGSTVMAGHPIRFKLLIDSGKFVKDTNLLAFISRYVVNLEVLVEKS